MRRCACRGCSPRQGIATNHELLSSSYPLFHRSVSPRIGGGVTRLRRSAQPAWGKFRLRRPRNKHRNEASMELRKIGAAQREKREDEWGFQWATSRSRRSGPCWWRERAALKRRLLKDRAGHWPKNCEPRRAMLRLSVRMRVEFTDQALETAYQQAI